VGKGGRCVGVTTLPLSCADCLEIRDPEPPGTLRACNRIALTFFNWYKKMEPRCRRLCSDYVTGCTTEE